MIITLQYQFEPLATPLCVCDSYFYRLVMEMTQNTCALCGKTIEKPEKSTYREVLTVYDMFLISILSGNVQKVLDCLR